MSRNLAYWVKLSSNKGYESLQVCYLGLSLAVKLYLTMFVNENWWNSQWICSVSKRGISKHFPALLNNFFLLICACFSNFFKNCLYWLQVYYTAGNTFFMYSSWSLNVVCLIYVSSWLSYLMHRLNFLIHFILPYNIY